MAGKGGYQAPARPAVASGPGSLSQRTDGGPASKQAMRYVSGMPNYGDGTDMMQIQSGAPMAATPNPSSASAPQVGGGQSQPAFGLPDQGFIGAHQPNPAENPLQPVPTQQQQAASGLQNALSLLNTLGDNASQQVKSIRNVLAAHLINQSQTGAAPTAAQPAPTTPAPMATPMAGAQQDMADTNTPPVEANVLGANLDSLYAAGHSNINPLAQVAVAQNSGTTQGVVNNGNLLSQAAQETTPEKSISEPAINNKPSLISQAASFLHHQYGPVPILASDISGIQKTLQSKGYAQGLASGTWNSQWQNALNQYSYDATTAPSFGNVKSLPLWERVVNEINPTGWSSSIAHAVGHYVANLPEEGRRLLSTAVGSGIIGQAATLIGSNQARAQLESKIETSLGGNLTPEEAQKTELQRNVGALGDLLSMISVAGATKAFATSVGDIGMSMVKNATTNPGVTAAAKSLVTRSLPESAAATPTFFVSKSLYQAGMQGAEGAAKGTGALRWLENVPVLKRMLPAIDAMSTPGSTYYKLSMQKASLMRNPIWQTAAVAQAKGSVAGLGLLGIGEAEQKVGINEKDSNLAAPYQGTLANVVNGLSMFMGHPTIGIKASQNVGQVVDAAHGALSDALGPINMDYVLKKGLGIPLKDLQKNLGNEFVNDYFLNTKVNQYAASHYAENALQPAIDAGQVDKNSPQAAKLFKQYEHDALTDPTNILAPTRESLLRQPDVLANYFKKDFANQLGSNVRKGISDSYDIADKNKDRFYAAMNKLKDAHGDVSVMLSDEHRNLFHGSRTQANVSDLLSNALAEDWGKRQTPFNSLVKGELNEPRTSAGILQAKASAPLYHFNKRVGEYMPDPASLESATRFGKGIKATDDPTYAGRMRTNVYTLRYKPTENEQPTFLDLRKKSSSSPIITRLRQAQATGQTRNELGLIGKTPKEYSDQYKTLAKMLKNSADYNGQDLLDAYRSALVSAGKLGKDDINSRISDITKGAMQDEGHAGFKFTDKNGSVAHVVNSDHAIANLTQLDPKLTMDSLIPKYLIDNNTVVRGSLGIARQDTFIQQDAQNAANGFFKRLAKAGYGPEVEQAQGTLQLENRRLVKNPDTELNAPLPKLDPQALNKEGLNVLNEARGILIKKLGFDALQVNKLDPIEAVSLIYRESHDLASEAFLPVNAPKAVQDAVSRLAAKGYRPVLGTDIGHAYESPILHPVIADQRTSLLRKAALALKLDPSKVTDISVATSKDIAQKQEIDRLFASGKVQPFVGDNSSTIINILRDYARYGMRENTTGNKLTNAIRGWGQGKRDQLITQLMGDTSNLTVKEENELRAEATRAANEIFGSQRRMSDLSYKQMIKALTQPVAKGAKDYLQDKTPRYSSEDAAEIAKAVMIGTAKTPGYTMGLGKGEDFIRASGAMATNATASFFGKIPLLNNFKIGQGPLAQAVTALPSDLTALRNRWRFDLNPVFSVRRLAKTNVKAATEGIPLTRAPYEAMTRLGIKDEAYNILSRTMPKVYAKAAELDSVDRFLAQNDPFNIFNPAHNMAWQAYHLKQLGMDDATIAQKLEKINTYGDRTPLERTVNTIFYPFSFNKTLYKNIGGYLLDHPGENALLNAGFQLYNHLDPKNQDPNNGLQNWFNNHLPVIQDLEKLNAFEHGTGLGQFGGINAPYLQDAPYIKSFMNLFSPQAITPAAAPGALKTLTNMVPALSELNGLLFNVNLNTGAANAGGVGSGRLTETAKVGYWELKNLAQHAVDLSKELMGKKVDRTYYTSTLPDNGQIQAGIDTVNTLKTQLANLVGSGQVWPKAAGVPKVVWGLPYNSTSFEMYAQALYPAYTPGAGVGMAVEKATQAKTFVQNLQGTFRFDAYNTFNTTAQSAVTKLSKTTDPTTIQNIANPLRALAVNIAEQDPKFVAFYNKFYESALGPIEGFSK